MSEEENVNVAESQDQAAVVQGTESESAQSERQEKADASQSRKRNDAEYNWAEARRKMQELEKRDFENREIIAKLQKQSSPTADDDDLSKLGDDEIVTKAQVKKLAAKMAKDIAQDVIKQREAATVDERLQLKYSDYAEVVSPESIQLLKETEPELALSLYHTPDPYAQGVAAYKLLKKLGVSAKDGNAQERKKAMENSQKPVSVQAVAKQSALGNAHLFENGLTKEVKKQLWDEMQRAMKAG